MRVARLGWGEVEGETREDSRAKLFPQGVDGKISTIGVCQTEGKRNPFQRFTHATGIEKDFMCCSQLQYK